MKILHIGKYFPPRYGGIETFMSQLMEEQVKQGLEVSALVHTDALQSSSGCYEWNGCRIFEVKSYGQLVFAPIAPGYPLKLIQVLRCLKPDILHIHMPNLSAFWVLFFKGLFAKKTKIVIHWHADVLGAAPTKLVRFFYPVYRILESCLLSVSQSVIATSPDYLSSSLPLDRFRSKAEVIPLGIQVLPHYTGSHPRGDVLKLIMIGRLTYYKNHEMVIKTVKRLWDENLPIELKIVGSGELETKLRKLIQDIGDSTFPVELLGGVSESQKRELLQDADMLLLPSKERTEAFGVVLLEAANYEKPVVVSDAEGSGMSYVVNDGENGFIVKLEEPDHLYSVLLKCCAHRDQLTEMGKKNYQKLKDKFDICHVAHQINRLYQKGLSDG